MLFTPRYRVSNFKTHHTFYSYVIELFSPPPETGEKFECKSVMYYYNEQECILNAETRHTKPDLFIPEGDEFQVRHLKFSHLKVDLPCPTVDLLWILN